MRMKETPCSALALTNSPEGKEGGREGGKEGGREDKNEKNDRHGPRREGLRMRRRPLALPGIDYFACKAGGREGGRERKGERDEGGREGGREGKKEGVPREIAAPSPSCPEKAPN